MENRKVLMVGLARSGQSAVKALYKRGAKVFINDMKSKEDLADILGPLEGMYEGLMLGGAPSVEGFDLLVLSPGVPLDKPFVIQAKEAGIEVIGELELASRLTDAKFIGITGTNGKTTTTALTGEIFKTAKRKHFVVGNIGIPVIERIEEADENTTMVTEVSSFQLETIRDFKTEVAAVLNLTPDHLNRHKTMENYIDAKCRIFENHGKNDVLVLNYDNDLTRNLASRTRGKVVYFSRKEALASGVFIKDGKVVIQEDQSDESLEVIDVADIFIPGDHNIENALAATAMAYYSDIEVNHIAHALRTFTGVAHRIEWLGEVDDVVFFNDSKGTNPDASIVAVKAMERPTVLIAGGMDKGSDFDSFIESFGEKIKHLVVFGETAKIIETTARKMGYESVSLVNDLDQAVDTAFSLTSSGDAILLSPACASWDMYPSFEHRGDHFRECFESLRRR
ncbi:UDP-N-acetylmuramoyl-L-alanine--D-glutamate ligase [Fusibacter sp. JL216-2]|uniref:UDP-N-acetylmuramoyl-L-alanine--D-glutamate ligase n=1 Tax=Fusibacter sp. JL216-2 TaxID=3071453 RepID=UPI003D33DE50